MSSANCPETPRQKMVGMMYLVLTAMLALNVSSDVLNAFTKVQNGLSHTINNFEKKNDKVYADFDKQYTLNKNKVRKWRDKAYLVKQKADELYKHIEDLKWEMVRKADGDKADVDNVLSKDNLDIGGEVMITFGKGKKLRKKIADYREFLKSFLDKKESVLRKGLDMNLNTDNPKTEPGERKTWESENFEMIPLVGVVTLLTKMQSDVRNAESDLISYLYKNIDEGSFRFNSISAHVLPESRYIIKGGTYKAKVFLAATDTTQLPVLEVHGRTISDRDNDASVYKVNCNKAGVYKWKGILKYKSPSGEVKNYSVEDHYIVAEPNVVVSPLKMNVFYLGVDNPVSVSVPGLATENLKIGIINGKMIKRGHNYIVRPISSTRSCDISVSSKIGGKVKHLQTLKFRVKTVPNPIAAISKKSGGAISKGLLQASWGVSAILKDFDFNMKFNVTGFTLYTIGSGGYVKEARSNSARFTQEQKNIIKRCKRGQRLIIDDIKAKGPDKRLRKLQSLTFKIQ
ncbi:gliding motility protein GldM [Marinilabiliaceae bacterium JC040]|nr:gliding motility protein GldM [Marinilabiliaceae bacterium JC040]